MMGNIGVCAGSTAVNDCGANSIAGASIAEEAIDRHRAASAVDRAPLRRKSPDRSGPLARPVSAAQTAAINPRINNDSGLIH
jgi:hypothetical protein